MNVLLDTNILTRMAQPGHFQYQIAIDATDTIGQRGDTPCLIPQVLYEFWVVATRPVSQNGLGFDVATTTTELSRIKSLFALFPDTATIFPEWEHLVTTLQVVGKEAHDARIVAAMKIHGLIHILTLNTADFARYPGVVPLDPATIGAPPKP